MWWDHSQKGIEAFSLCVWFGMAVLELGLLKLLKQYHGSVAGTWLNNIFEMHCLDHASDSNVTSCVSDFLLVWFFPPPPQFFTSVVKICSFSFWLWAVARIRRDAEQCGMGYLKFHWVFSRLNKPIRYSKISFNKGFGGCHFCFSGLLCSNSERIVLDLFLCQLFWIL